MLLESLKNEDPAIFSALYQELNRQATGIELIASENFVSEAVLAAVGSVLTNKYAEGYPGRRYYGGCIYNDEVENLAIARAKQLFGAQHVNMQPHSGASANLAAYFSLAKPGDTVLAMSLDHGGHLTHGSPVNFSGKQFNIVPYGLHRETERLDYEEVARLAREARPTLIIAGASAYARQIDFARFAQIARDVGAKLLVDMAHIAGLVAAGVHPSPVPYADVVTTTTHKSLRGPRGGMVLCQEAYAKTINSAVFPQFQGGPLMHVIAGKAVCLLEALKGTFVDYQKQVIKNAQALAEALVERNFRLVSGGTDNHLMLVDLRPKGITGKDAEKVLERVGIVVNKNKIPFDDTPAQITSGMRLGTPATTTRGMGTEQMHVIAGLIDDALGASNNESRLSEIAQSVERLSRQFPLYEGLRKEFARLN